MKIVYIAGYGSNFPSRDANSIHIMRMCEAITKLGHEVILIVSSRKKTEEEIFDHYGIKKCFHIKIIRVPLIKGKTLIYNIKSNIVAKSLKPDLLISRCAKSAALSALRGIQTVYDSHGPVWEKDLIEISAYSFLRKSKYLIRMTTNSKALKNIYEKSGKIPSHGVIAANNGGLMLPLNEIPGKWPGRQDALQIGYIGHLYPGRGADIIVECARQLPPFDFHIIGGTEDDIEYWKKKANYDNLYFHGFVKHSDIHRYRNKCDVLLAPYMDKNVAMAGGGGDQSKYMNPIKIVEYMSSKKAIICSDIPILKELLDENSAVFASPGNIDEWISAINKMQNTEFRKSLASNAYDKFKDKLTWEARAKLLIYGYS